MRDDGQRLLDMIECCERIKKYASLGRSRFDSDELVQGWIIHQLLILGEAAARVSDEFREDHPEIPWGKMIGTRNILVHGYFAINHDVVWAAVQKDLPDLEQQIRHILG